MLEHGIKKREGIRRAAVDGKGATMARRPTGLQRGPLLRRGWSAGSGAGCTQMREGEDRKLSGAPGKEIEGEKEEPGVGGGHGNEGMG